MELKLYTNRLGHFDHYRIERTPEGWKVQFLDTKPSNISKDGESLLKGKAEQDSIHYPNDFGNFLACLWQYAGDNNLSDDEIQVQLDLLGEWQKATEVGRPKGIWEGILG